MATPAIVARVSSLQGEVFAKDANGVMRPLQVGDPVYEGEVLITTDNGRVTLATGDGQSLRVNPGDIVVLDAEVLGEAKPDVTDAALQAPGAEAARIIQAIKSGGNLDDLLEETAAGEAGGSAGGGPSFVRLLRIAEAIDPLSYQFDTGRPAGVFDPDNTAQGAAIAFPAPTIIPVDGNGGASGQATVNERGLTSAADTSETVTGSITLTTPGGMTGISVNGIAFTLTQLSSPAVLAATPVDTGTGTLTLTGYDAATGVLTYSYTLNGAVNQPGADVTQDTIALTVTSVGGTAASSLVIQIIDSLPTAANDVNAVTEDAPTTILTGNVFSNDAIGADIPAAPVTPAAVTLNYGSLVLLADGSYTYTLDNGSAQVQGLAAGQTVTDSYRYKITDADGDEQTATLTITITGTNDAPVAVNDTGSVQEDATLMVNTVSGVIQGMGTDSDVDGDTLQVTAVRTGTESGSGTTGTVGTVLHGTYGDLTLFADGNYNYVANNANALATGVTATDTFTYTISDGEGGSDVAELAIEVTGTNDIPVARLDTAGVTEDTITFTTGNVLGNDGDIDTGDLIHVTGIAAGSVAATSSNVPASNVPANVPGTYGSVAIAADGQYTYTLNNPSIQSLAQGQTVTDTFTYTITDSQGASSATTLTVTVTGTNDAPNVYVGSGDRSIAAFTEANVGLTTTGTLSVTDIDTTDQVSASVVSAVTVGGTYLALAGNVVPANSTLLNMFSVSGGESSTTAQTAANGISWVFNSGSEAFNQLPKDATLILTYTVRATDSFGATDDQLVTITITGTNDTPVVTADTIGVTEDAVDQSGYNDSDVNTTIVAGNVLSNDSDVDTGDVIRVTSVAAGTPPSASGSVAASVAGTYGSVVIAADGSYRYVLDDSKPSVQALALGQTVTDTFTYTIADSQGATRSTTLTVTVTGSNDAPDIFVSTLGGDSDTASLTETNSGLTTAGTLSVYDVDTRDIVTPSVSGVSVGGTYAGLSSLASKVTMAQLLAMMNVSGGELSTTSQSAEHGVTWTFNSGTQAFDFIPAGQALTLTYTIKATDNSGGANNSDTQLVTITINGTDDGITLVNDVRAMPENASGAASSGNVLANDSIDPDFGEATLVTGFTLDSNGDGTQESYAPGASVTVTSATEGTLGVFTLAADGTYSFTPYLANFSGTVPTITYTAVSPAAHTGTATLDITVTPVADAPGVTVDAAAVNTLEDTSVTLGFNAPTLSSDVVDQNGPAAGDNPERLGLITLSGIPSGAQLLDGTNGNAALFTSNGGAITVLLSDVPAAQMIANPGAATLTMTRTQFEAMRVLPAADNATNFTATMSVTEYEVDDAGNPLSGIAGATTSTTVAVDVRAVTDAVDLKIGGSDASPSAPYSATISEDTPLNLTSLLSAAFDDRDGSEQRSITITNLPGNGTIYVNGHAVSGGASYTIAATDAGNDLETSQTGFPLIQITAPGNFSGDLKGITVTLSAKDTDADSTVTTSTQSDSVTLDLYVQPVADPVTVTNVTTREDTGVLFLQGVALTDTDGSETLTGVAINALPAGWVIRDHAGIAVFTGDGATAYTVPAGAVANGDFRNYTLTPPANSSADISVSLSLTSTDTKTVNGVPLTDTQTNVINQTVTVTPVAERTGTDTDGDSIPDLTINPSHVYSALGGEDLWFSLKQSGEGFDPKTGWSNEDTDETTYALLTPTLSGGSAIGSQFSYTDASGTHALTYTGTALRIPMTALDTVQFKAAANVSGTFEIQVQALTIDTDPDTGATVQAISGLSTLTQVVIAPIADPVTLAVNAPAVGNEDMAIPLVIRATSADPSETFTVTISGIPAGATITYGGVDQVVTGGTVSIANFNSATALTITPPANSNVDIPLLVSTVSVDTSDGITSTSATATLPLLVDVRGVADPVVFTINSPWSTTEAAVDGSGRRISLSGAISAVTPLDNDGSESVTVVVSGVPTGVTLQGLHFMGGVGASRVWSGTPAEIAAASLVVRDANFNGTISFSVRAVSTENDGNSLSGPSSTVTIEVTPSPEALLATQTTTTEDTRTQVDFSIVPQNGDTDETLLSVWIDAADLASKPFTLYLGNVPLSAALTADGGWYKLSAADAANVYVQGAANSDADAGFAVRYAISDPGRNGLPDTVTQFDGSYSINVAAVTDATLSSNSYAGGEIASTTTVAVNVKVTQQGDAGAGGLPDTDGSEQLRYFIIDNVPLGVSVEGGRYIGNTPGNANTGRWILDMPDVAFTTASLNQTINFALNGTSEQLNDLSQPINVTAYTQDGSGALRTSTTTWTLDTADGFVASGSGSGAPAATIVDWHPATSTGMSEDTPKSLAGLVSAEITGTSPYAVTITGLPAGSAISGMMLTSIGGQDVWTAQGEGDNASLQSLLASITITPPANLNSNTPGGFSFATTLTTYDNSGTRHDASAAVMPPVAPVSDASVIATTNTDVAEDQTVPITLSLSNAADGAKAQVVDGHVYIRLDESGMDAAGKLSVGGTELLATSVSGVAGIPDGMYFVLSGVSSTDTLSLSYQPAVNASGSVSYTAYVQNQEIGAANVVTSSQTGAFTISPENDGATVSVSPANGLEDTLIPLSIGVSQTDASETIASVTLDNVPDGFLVYAGGQLAINLGGGVWGIPLSGGHLPANVALMPPINWSGTLTPLHLSVWSGEPDLDPTLTTSSIAVSVNGVADGISLTPTLSFGDERAIVPLNLNSTMTDHDGSETATLTISKLGAYAAFYSGTTLLAASYDAGSDTYTLSGLTPDQVTGLGVIQKNGSYDLQITAHTVESVGGDASASLPTTLHLDINPIAATSGNDTLLYGGSALNGLAGVDTIELRLGEDIDFATAVKPTNIERIDLMPGGQDHSLNHLTLQDVLDMTGSSKTLTILGDSGDSVGLKNGVASDDQWVKDLATVTDGTHVFDVYTNAHDAAVKILIDQQITQRHIDS